MENAAATSVRLNAMPNDNEEATVSVSTDLTESGWDKFIRTTPLGEIQQSSIWARYKSIDGWECTRVLLKCGQEIVGGFQLLWRATRFGRIGYVSKGPVLKEETAEGIDALTEALVKTAVKLNLRALVIQPPGRSRQIAPHLLQAGFFLDRLMNVNAANLVVDVRQGIEAIEAGMRRTTRQQLRRAVRSGVEVRKGNEQDLGTFFQLMLESCKRQDTAPNPSSEAALKELWAEARPSNACRLTIAEHDGHPIAGLLCLPFGDEVSLWKKGSLPEFFRLHAMEVLYCETFSWAHANGFKTCNFSAMSRGVAEALLNGRPLSDDQKKGRDIFNLGFGGKPALLPEAYIYIPNQILATGYRWAVRSSFLNRYLKRAVS